MRNLGLITLAGIALLPSPCTGATVHQDNARPGLAGMTYNSEDFTQPDETDVLLGVDNDWGASRGNDWSASWYGFIEGPCDGVVEFSAEANDGIRLRIGDAEVIDGLNADGARGGSARMVKGSKVPIGIDFTTGRGQARLVLSWQWKDADRTVVPPSALSHEMDKLPLDIRAEFVVAGTKGSESRTEGFSSVPDLPAEMIDLSGAGIVILGTGTILNSAAEMLRDEISKRTRLDLEIDSDGSADGRVAILIGTEADFRGGGGFLPAGLSVPAEVDGYALWQSEDGDGTLSMNLIGHDERGALFAAGRLLRLLWMERDVVGLEPGVRLASSPGFPLRGHQMGYRPKTNSYDAWNLEMWEQYFRDMIVFGMNAVEIVPPKTDDHFDSPHFPKPPMEMMIGLSGLAEKYGLDLWIWYPGIEGDFSDPAVMEFAMREREAVFSRLPKVDAVFVPSGDPSEIHPDQLFPLMEAQKKVLNRYHPEATIWSSVQNYDDEPATMGWIEAFYAVLKSGQADWLDGVVFGPATEITLPEMRAGVPQRFPIRRYPDITHSKDCQYEVDDWDEALERTEGREPINPRPKAFASIFRENQNLSIGFISYSEGCNDDVNKVVWSSLGWDPDQPVEDILAEYSRYFIGPRHETAFARGLLDLESNWTGPLRENDRVYETLIGFQTMESQASPQLKLNWRFQQALYRAHYDAFIKARLDQETELERAAIEMLWNADQIGSLAAVGEAEAILRKVETDPVATEWRARVFELGEALFQSVGMQLDLLRYHAKEVGRGANLDLIDVPLNNRRQLLELFAEIRELDSESDRLERIAEIAEGEIDPVDYDWEDLVEEALSEENPEWFVRRGAADLEHGPAFRSGLKAGETEMAGLIGFRSGNADFRDPESMDVIKKINHDWTGGLQGWSGYWTGYIEAPYTGEVIFMAEADNGLKLSIDDNVVIDGLGRGTDRQGRAKLVKGRLYPIRLWYFQSGDPSCLRLYWSWAGQPKKITDGSAFSHDSENVKHALGFLD